MGVTTGFARMLRQSTPALLQRKHHPHPGQLLPSCPGPCEDEPHHPAPHSTLAPPHSPPAGEEAEIWDINMEFLGFTRPCPTHPTFIVPASVNGTSLNNATDPNNFQTVFESVAISGDGGWVGGWVLADGGAGGWVVVRVGGRGDA